MAKLPTPDYVPPHDLLAGKNVLMTAAAGAGTHGSLPAAGGATVPGARATVSSDIYAEPLYHHPYIEPDRLDEHRQRREIRNRIVRCKWGCFST